PDAVTTVVVGGALALSSLLFWRRGNGGRARGEDGASPDVESPRRPPGVAALLSPSPPAPVAPSRALTLTLARVIPETPGAKTFRFRVPEETALSHKAGQFMTFEWVVDGRKVARWYSLSSS